jgi:hypothetical protein
MARVITSSKGGETKIKNLDVASLFIYEDEDTAPCYGMVVTIRGEIVGVDLDDGSWFNTETVVSRLPVGFELTLRQNG